MSKSSLKEIVSYLKLGNIGKIEFNTMISQIQIDRKNVFSGDLNKIRVSLSRDIDMECSKDLISSALEIPGEYSEFNPLRDLQEKHKKRKVKTGFIEAYASRIPTDLGFGEADFRPNAAKELFLHWYVGMIAGGLPENKRPNEIMLILIGAQNNGKTWFFENLLPDSLKQYFTKAMLKDDLSDMELKVKMSQYLLVLDDEGDYMTDKSNSSMKEILSSREILYMKKYSNMVDKVIRVASFGKTSNLTDHLRDETGNRRYFIIDTDTLEKNLFRSIKRDPSKKEIGKEDLERELMIVEALDLYDNGFKFQLNSEQVEYYNTQMENNHVQGVEHSFIENYFNLEESMGDRHVITYLEFENFAKIIMKGTYNRAMLKVAMRSKGFILDQYRLHLSSKKVSGYAISKSSNVLDPSKHPDCLVNFNGRIDINTPPKGI